MTSLGLGLAYVGAVVVALGVVVLAGCVWGLVRDVLVSARQRRARRRFTREAIAAAVQRRALVERRGAALEEARWADVVAWPGAGKPTSPGRSSLPAPAPRHRLRAVAGPQQDEL